ncbi:magnesium transporter NIPA-domain-containing protein [Mycena sp. CBHHK59/15]|nr:magnesium transporter NIPA-domain-containing protein [Mycena sp. CBHHK59/15]
MSFLRNSMWWAKMSALVVGEVANFGAYMFAPPVMVTPLGALGVIIGCIYTRFDLSSDLFSCFRAIFASFLLNEQLGHLGRVGCAMCILGSSIIVLHAPGDQDLETAVEPGHNQFIYPSTYLFGVISVVCIVIQLNYANKALDLFSFNLYVGFCTATTIASLILFKGLNTTSVTDTLSLLTGFVVTFLGVHILNLAMLDPDSLANSLAMPDSAPMLPLDGGSPWTQHAHVPGHTTGHARRASLTGLRTPLFGAFPREGGIGLGSGDVRLELLEEDEQENEFRRGAQLLPSAWSTRTSTRPPNIRISRRPPRADIYCNPSVYPDLFAMVGNSGGPNRYFASTRPPFLLPRRTVPGSLRDPSGPPLAPMSTNDKAQFRTLVCRGPPPSLSPSNVSPGAEIIPACGAPVHLTAYTGGWVTGSSHRFVVQNSWVIY